MNYHHKWLIGDCDEEIGRYYRWLIKSFRAATSLQAPLNGPHITVVAGKYEDNIRREYWYRHANKKVEFEYGPELETNGVYYWLPVKSLFLSDIRLELGLFPLPKYPFHLTVGNNKL